MQLLCIHHVSTIMSTASNSLLFLLRRVAILVALNGVAFHFFANAAVDFSVALPCFFGCFFSLRCFALLCVALRSFFW